MASRLAIVALVALAQLAIIAAPVAAQVDAGRPAVDAGLRSGDAGTPAADAATAEASDAGVVAADAGPTAAATPPGRPPIRPLPGHAVFLLLVQLALLLIAARLGSEIAKRFGLPAVVGELAAGIVLGPSLFGHYAPGTFDAIFPAESEQFHLLEVVGTLGMTLLLLLTGLETDLRLLRNLGRAALIASIGGMVIPFAMGLGLGLVLPEEYLAQPDRRVLFALFLATAMSISAMPVIAKILMDLDLARRNIGLVILSAGVVDDTAGWLILSMIAGAASQGTVEIWQLLITLGFTLAFLAACAFVLYPGLRLMMRVANERFRSPETDLVLIVVVTILCAAATEWIGVHAVFGAFICGTVLRQVPGLREDTVHKLESFVFQILAPVFFGIVGLKVNLWALAEGGGWTILGVVVTVAILGKLVGCTVGSLWGGLRFWESLSIAVAMNARGAMELVVATIGLSLGILNQQMFSIIVVVAIVTSFMAPVLLRITMKRVVMTEEEQRRLLAEETRGIVDPERVRVLVPASENTNCVSAAILASGLARRSKSPVTIFHTDVRMTLWQRLLHPFSKPEKEGFDRTLGQVREKLEPTPHTLRRTSATNVGRSILDELAKGFDVAVLGASADAIGSHLGGHAIEDVVSHAACHVVIVKGKGTPKPFERIFVPVDGSIVSRAATEVAVRYAEATGAEITLGLVVERRPVPSRTADGSTGGMDPTLPGVALEPVSTADALERITPLFKSSAVKPTIERVEHEEGSSALIEAVVRGKHDLVIIGAENRAIQHKLFFGHETERLIRKAPASIAVVVPHVGQGRRQPSMH